jgi:uncharacterized membrane protein
MDLIQKGLVVGVFSVIGLAMLMVGILLSIPLGAVILAFVLWRQNDRNRKEYVVRYDVSKMRPLQ